MLTTFDKAWAAFLGPILVFMAQAIMDPDKVPMDVISDPNMWVMAIAAGAMAWFVPNRGTIGSWRADESGAVGLRYLFAIVIGLFLLAACTGNEKDSVRTAAVLQCSAQATAQGMVFGSPERTAYIASCITPVIVDVVVDEIVDSEGVEPGGG